MRLKGIGISIINWLVGVLGKSSVNTGKESDIFSKYLLTLSHYPISYLNDISLC